jgi:hypothetical protein
LIENRLSSDPKAAKNLPVDTPSSRKFLVGPNPAESKSFDSNFNMQINESAAIVDALSSIRRRICHVHPRNANIRPRL